MAPEEMEESTKALRAQHRAVGPVLPFKEAAGAEAPPPTPVAPGAATDKVGTGGTMGTSGAVSPLAGRSALPFQPSAERRAPAPVGGASPLHAAAEVRGAAEVARGPTLSVEQYAWLCASFATSRDRGQASCREYGITDDAIWQAAEQDWRRRLTADPAARAEFERLLAHYRSWIEGQRA